MIAAVSLGKDLNGCKVEAVPIYLVSCFAAFFAFFPYSRPLRSILAIVEVVSDRYSRSDDI